MVDVEDVTLAVGGVRLQVAAVAVSRRLVKVEILVYKFGELFLNISKFVGRELELVRLDFLKL